MVVEGRLRDDELLDLADEQFVAVWIAAFGEPPAAIIDRVTMIELLCEATSAAVQAAAIASAREAQLAA